MLINDDESSSIAKRCKTYRFGGQCIDPQHRNDEAQEAVQIVKPGRLLVACGKEHGQCGENRDCGYDGDEIPAFDHAFVHSGYVENGQWRRNEMNGVQYSAPVVSFVLVVDYRY